MRDLIQKKVLGQQGCPLGENISQIYLEAFTKRPLFGGTICQNGHKCAFVTADEHVLLEDKADGRAFRSNVGSMS